MKTVCLVGLAPATRDDFINEPEGTEIWSLNMGHAYFSPAHMSKMTRWFQIHPYEEMAPRQNPVIGHLEWLRSAPIPVYMEEVHPDIPTSVRYPYEEVCRNIGGNYMTSAPAFMLALALHEGFDLIKIYGIDLDCDLEWAYERSCFEHLLGIAMGRGAKVWIPNGCPLLKGNLYGKTVHIRSSTVAEMHRQAKMEESKLVAELNVCLGRLELAEALKGEELINKVKKEVEIAQADLNANQGGLDVLNQLLDIAYRGPDGLGAARTGQVVSADGSVRRFSGGLVELPELTVATPKVQTTEVH